MIRAFYIANTATGDYLVITDNMSDFLHRVYAYSINLQNSKKCPNTYTIGSVELSKSELLKLNKEAKALEESLINAKKPTKLKVID